jgi:hypothetical protein
MDSPFKRTMKLSEKFRMQHIARRATLIISKNEFVLTRKTHRYQGLQIMTGGNLGGKEPVKGFLV